MGPPILNKLEYIRCPENKIETENVLKHFWKQFGV